MMGLSPLLCWPERRGFLGPGTTVGVPFAAQLGIKLLIQEFG